MDIFSFFMGDNDDDDSSDDSDNEPLPLLEIHDVVLDEQGTPIIDIVEIIDPNEQVG